MHVALPASLLILPASHLTQEPAAPVNPAGHSSIQALSILLPAGDNFPVGQEVHEDSLLCSSLTLYLPGAQRRQTLEPADAKYVPAAQFAHVVAASAVE